MISLHSLRRLRRMAAPLAIAILAAGCGGGDGPTPPPPPPVPAAIAPTGGSGQQGAAGLTLPIALVARVTDAQGRPVSGVNVTWQVTAGGGTIIPSGAATDAAGEARAQWTLGTTAGANTATATVAGLAAAQFTALGFAGTPAVVVVTPDAVTLEVGGTQLLSATASDAFGNVTGFPFQWSVVEGTAATVDANGRVQATAVGTARIAASAGTRADTATVTVQAASTLRLSTVSAGGVASCGLTSGEGVPYCWGANYARQLGRPPVGGDCQGNGDCSLVPVAAQTSERFTTLSLGRDGGCAITAERRLYCWGRYELNSMGSLPTLILPDLGTVISVGVGDGFFCFVESGGQATCRGQNDDGQLGTGGATGGTVAGGIAFASVDAGTRHACGLTAAGAAYCWGRNDRGQLGAPSAEFCNGLACSRTPVAVSGGHTFRSITAGREFTCGITTAGAALCWGSNHTGQLGTGSTATSSSTPTPVAGGLTFAQIDASGISELAGHACGVTTAGDGYCWGANARGELGVTQDLPLCSTPAGSYFCTRTPLRVASPTQATTWRVISAGMTHSCGVTTGNRAYCWGENTLGQLGDGTRANRQTPVAVADPR